MEKLLQAGASRIGCVLGPEQVYTTKKRFQGFQEGMALHKASYREQDVYHGSFTVQDGKKAFALLIAQGCDGLFVENERMTQGVLEAAAEQGLQIGRDLKLAAYDHPGTEPVITIRQNLTLMAEKAVDRLIERVEEPETQMPPGNFYVTPTVEDAQSERTGT